MRSLASCRNEFSRLAWDDTHSSAIAANFFLRTVPIFGPNAERDSAARGKLRGNCRFPGRTCSYEIVENAIGDGFVERPFVPIRSEIKLERLAFDAKQVRQIIDLDSREIGLAGHWTETREIVGLKMNVIVSTCRIRKCFKARFRRTRRQFRFTAAQKSQARVLGFCPLHCLNVQRVTVNFQIQWRSRTTSTQTRKIASRRSI